MERFNEKHRFFHWETPDEELRSVDLPLRNDARANVWLSVDPLGDEMPSWLP